MGIADRTDEGEKGALAQTLQKAEEKRAARHRALVSVVWYLIGFLMGYFFAVGLRT